MLLVELLAFMSVLAPGVPVEPEAPIDVPLPVPAVVESVVPVVAAVLPDRLPEPEVDVSALVVGADVAGGLVVVELLYDVDVSVDGVSRWQAASDSAAIRARAAQRAMGMVVIDTP